MMEFSILIFATAVLSLALAEHIPVHHPRDLRPRYASETHPPYPISSGSTAAPLGTSSGSFVPYSYAPHGLSTSGTAIGTIASYDSALHSILHPTGPPSLPTVDPVSSNASMNSTRQHPTIFRTSRRTHTITDTVEASSSSTSLIESTSTGPYYSMSNSSSATVSPTASGSVMATFSPEQTATIESSFCITPLGHTYCFSFPSSTPSSSSRPVSSYVNGSSTAPASSYSSTPSTAAEAPVTSALNSTSRASGNTSSSGWFSSIISTAHGLATFTGGASSTPGHPMWPNATSSSATESLVSSSVSSSTSISSTSAVVTIISIIPAMSDSPVQSTALGSATGGVSVDTTRLPSATLSINSSSTPPPWTIQPSNATSEAPASSPSTFSPFNSTISLSTNSSIGTLTSPSSTNGIPWTSINAPESMVTLLSLSTRVTSSYQTLTTSSLFMSLTSTTSSTPTGTNETSSSTSNATTFQTLASPSSITASSTSSEQDPVYPTYGYGSANNQAGKEQEKGGAQKWPFSWSKLRE